MVDLRPSVLVVETQLSQRSATAGFLRQMGYKRVLEAADSTEALGILNREGPVDIAMCDLRVTDSGGIAFVKQLAKSDLADSVIITSSLPEDLRNTAEKIVTLSGLNFLGDAGKPVRTNALTRLIQSHPENPTTATRSTDKNRFTEAEVLQAFERNEFSSHFQPIFNLRTGVIVGVEALTRWENPSIGSLSPSLFLPILDQHNMLGKLFFIQLEKSLILLQQAGVLRHYLSASLNISAGVLAEPSLVGRIKKTLVQHNIHPSCLTLELTETGLIEARSATLEALFELRLMGCCLSIDDFGTGHSSMRRLCELPFTQIKIDRSFVQNIHAARCKTVINSALALGENLGMSVVIEGIETPEQLGELIEMGGRLGQGYLVARPMDSNALLRWLKKARHSILS